MKQSPATLADWRAQVDKELAGADFDKSLVHTTPEGLRVEPLYVETSIDPGLPGAPPFLRGSHAAAAPFQVCMRVDAPAVRRPEALAEDLAGGADAFWLDAGDDEALAAALGHGLAVLIEAGAMPPSDVLAWLSPDRPEQARAPASARRRAEPDAPPTSPGLRLGPDGPRSGRSGVILAIDPISAAARGLADAAAGLAALTAAAPTALAMFPDAPFARVSSLPFHNAGADAADELALTLAAGVATLRALLDAGIPLADAAPRLTVQIAVGRDTFGELCKLRALRLIWHKMLAAAGAAAVPLRSLHAVCSPRTQSQRDPWVNMLRVTTEVFAAALGGAELVTPLAFDDALAAPSALGRRVARNTALVLREESHLGQVIDPAGGAYYLETRTDALARAAWDRFTAVERDGGIVPILTSGALRERLESAWSKRAAAIARRKEPILGVSEFANLTETLPAPPPPPPAPPPSPALLAHRDAEVFEALRTRAEQQPRDVALVLLGPPAEHRARQGYASAFFAAAGLATRDSAEPTTADIACLCGSDERYATDAAARAAELRAAGCKHVVLAGRPGALEPALRAAGVDTFIFVGCDVAATLSELLS